MDKWLDLEFIESLDSDFGVNLSPLPPSEEGKALEVSSRLDMWFPVLKIC